jgi:hypothetical protein
MLIKTLISLATGILIGYAYPFSVWIFPFSGVSGPSCSGLRHPLKVIRQRRKKRPILRPE